MIRNEKEKMSRTTVTCAHNGLLSSPDLKVRPREPSEFPSFQKRCHRYRKFLNCCSISRLTYEQARLVRIGGLTL